MFGRWYADWYQWTDQNHLWAEEFYQQHLNASLLSQFDKLRTVVELGKLSSEIRTRYRSESSESNGRDVVNRTKAYSKRRKLYDKVSDERRSNTFSSAKYNLVYNLIKASRTSRMSEFYGGDSVPEDIWPGKMREAGVTLKQRAIVGHSYFSGIDAPRPVLASAVYEVEERACDAVPPELKTFTAFPDSGSESLDSRGKVAGAAGDASDSCECFTLLDVGDLVRKWLIRVNPWRRKHAKLSFLFYVLENPAMDLQEQETRRRSGSRRRGDQNSNIYRPNPVASHSNLESINISSIPELLDSFSSELIQSKFNSSPSKLNEPTNLNTRSGVVHRTLPPSNAVDNEGSIAAAVSNVTANDTQAEGDEILTSEGEKNSTDNADVFEDLQMKLNGNLFYVDKHLKEWTERHSELYFVIDYKMEGEINITSHLFLG